METRTPFCFWVKSCQWDILRLRVRAALLLAASEVARWWAAGVIWRWWKNKCWDAGSARVWLHFCIFSVEWDPCGPVASPHLKWKRCICILPAHHWLCADYSAAYVFVFCKGELRCAVCDVEEKELGCLTWFTGCWFNLKELRRHSMRDRFLLQRGLNFQDIHICFKLSGRKVKKRNLYCTYTHDTVIYNKILSVWKCGIPWHVSSMKEERKSCE